jgi:peptide/nickel transport system ATP-binding protein
LGGDPPDPQQIPSGCPFHPRCERAIDACTTVVPELWDAGVDRRAACVHVVGAPSLNSVVS